jgi:peptide methionine sulfoxide reductase msrA/msrB
MKNLPRIITFFLAWQGCVACTPNEKTQNIGDEKRATFSFDTTWTQKTVKTDKAWRKILSESQYYILRQSGTERPFSSELNNEKRDGVFICAACENPLFSTKTKFDSGTGWPSFWQPYFSRSVLVGSDTSQGMVRDEVFCGKCGGHLGHVFDDGPKPTGLRYCMNGDAMQFLENKKIERAVFAQGCFWCVEEIFEAVKGVEEVISGYAGGTEKNPTYTQVGSGATSHAEAVEVWYDPKKISYDDLLTVFFNAGDISQINGQGPDLGRQYRSIIFYKTQAEKEKVNAYLKQLYDSDRYKAKIAVEIVPFEKFYKAESYHQDYVKQHPDEGYVRSISLPRYQKAVKNFPELLKHP